MDIKKKEFKCIRKNNNCIILEGTLSKGEVLTIPKEFRPKINTQ